MNVPRETLNLSDSKRLLLPVDEVAPRHVEIHGDLEAWGRWSREKRSRMECASVERAYRPPNGNIDMGWEHNAPENKPVQLPNERVRALDRAILALPQLHLAGVRLHYWHMCPPKITCRKLALRFVDFGGFMEKGRDMVENILRRQAQSS